MDYEQLTYRIAFASIANMSIDLAKKFLDVIPSEQDFFAMSTKELQHIANSRSKVLTGAYRKEKLEAAKQEIEFITKNKILPTHYTDKEFSSRLAEAPDAPTMLFTMGNCDLNAKHIISIVGTRHATAYGKSFVNRLIADIAASLDDVVVVSGLAYGIDIAAHEACLKQGIPTVAVLAHGLNTIYPSSHRRYAADIIHSNGMLITEYTSQSSINKGNFVARNRIVAGLSDCTIVVESAKHGGALITANIAQSYNREVFAVPGRTTDEYSAGCNHLIQNNGAQLVTNLDDIIESMHWAKKESAVTPQQKTLFPELSPEEEAILQIIKEQDSVHINTLAQTLKKPVYQLLSTLVEMEFKGIVSSLPGSRYAIA